MYGMIDQSCATMGVRGIELSIQQERRRMKCSAKVRFWKRELLG